MSAPIATSICSSMAIWKVNSPNCGVMAKRHATTVSTGCRSETKPSENTTGLTARMLSSRPSLPNSLSSK